MRRPDDTAFERVHLLDQDRAEKMHDRGIKGAGAAAARRVASQYGLDVLGCIELPPGIEIDLLPRRVGHDRMVRDPVIEVVFVEIGVHRHALGVQNLVILRERREEEELDQVERHLPLDDLDIAGDLLRRVVRKAEDVAGICDHADVLPGL